MNKNRFPLFVDISEKEIAVVGGGTIGQRRIDTLLKFTNKIVLFDTAPEKVEKKYKGAVKTVKKAPEAEDLQDFFMVLLCTDNHEYNKRIYEALKGRGILRNCCDSKENCDFYFPSVVTDGPMTVGINGSGQNHSGTKKLRQDIEKMMKGSI